MYAELVCRSNFSFLEGASHPEELIDRALTLGLRGLALTDRGGIYGVARAHAHLKKRRQQGHPHAEQLQFIVGATLTVAGIPPLVLLAQNEDGYANLCSLITQGRRRAPKGCSQSEISDLEYKAKHLVAILLDVPSSTKDLRHLRQVYGEQLYFGLARHCIPEQEQRTAQMIRTAADENIDLCAINDVLYHHPSRKALQDVITCIRLGCTLEEAGRKLQRNELRYLRSAKQIKRCFRDLPQAIRSTLQISESCTFSLDSLRYQYPSEVLPVGVDPNHYLETLVQQGVAWRYGQDAPRTVLEQIQRELALIKELDFPHYFLTVYDLVRFAREQKILCQGRGSAANSAVCFVLGITSVDPATSNLLFERFISRERGEPPDIDVDFEHERREEVIQYLYGKYGRDRAAMACTYVCYRNRSTFRDVGKVMDFTPEVITKVSNAHRHRRQGIETRVFQEAGLNPESARVRMYGALVKQLLGFPRHLSIHTGGFILSDQPLHRIVPVENASMPGRTVIQWDKEDLESLGLLKVDVLGLGMLTCLRKSFDLIEQHTGRQLSLATIPPEKAAVYDMICEADTVGVFQIESRAQMGMLPRLKPRNFYDLVVEIAIIRPGPIQGNMVHPYLRRRNGEEAVVYPHPALEEILGRTYGVPLFQEQVMRLATAVADFTPGEADELRRAMGAWRRTGQIHKLGVKLIQGMKSNGLSTQFAKQVFAQIQGFAEYGFPESHAASFAHLVYASCFIKHDYPAHFCCALLNSQPMGFYPPRTLVNDAHNHGVCVRPVDIQTSTWDCTLEPYINSQNQTAFAIRLGLRMIKGLPKSAGLAIESSRAEDGPFHSISELQTRTALQRQHIERLAAANALLSLASGRRQALWTARGLPRTSTPLLDGAWPPAEEAELPRATPLEEVIADYETMGLCAEHHPLEFIRTALEQQGVSCARDLPNQPNQGKSSVAGIVVCRQQPMTASGVVFLSLEDETGMANVVVWPRIFARFRDPILHAPVLLVEGKLERAGLVANIIAQDIRAIQISKHALKTSTRSFH